ncbi:MAG: hypothetical protein KGL39_08760 [Patescibacteria group bacterium]|nr:hypothetical protein [Patescibacteria group bacterium]
MNTYLPFASFNSLGLLSNADLAVQVYQAREIIHLLEDAPFGWYKEPASLQWYGYIDALKDYYNLCVVNWVRRGFKTDCKPYTDLNLRDAAKLPPWVGDERVHSYHRSALWHRSPTFYSRYGWAKTDLRPFYPNLHARDDFGKLIYEKEKPKEFNWNRFFNEFRVETK